MHTEFLTYWTEHRVVEGQAAAAGGNETTTVVSSGGIFVCGDDLALGLTLTLKFVPVAWGGAPRGPSLWPLSPHR